MLSSCSLSASEDMGATVNGDVFQVSKILSLQREGLTAWVSVTFWPPPWVGRGLQVLFIGMGTLRKFLTHFFFFFFLVV